MTVAHGTIQGTLSEVERLRRIVAKGISKQVYSASELDLIKATVHTWFHTRRPVLVAVITEPALKDPDLIYQDLLAATNRGTSRTRYLELLKTLKRLLGKLQADKAIELSIVRQQRRTPDTPPSFTTIAADPEMQQLLTNRWVECVGCVEHNLPLAATVMMGGLLEALLLSRINRLADQSPVFKAKAAPKERATGTALRLREWSLSNYIDVAHELGWISDTYKDVGEILRDYRNYIHPYKEYQHKKILTADDSKMLWDIAKTLVQQVLKP